GQRPAAIAVSGLTLVLVALLGIRASQVSEGVHSATGTLTDGGSNVVAVGRALFTDYVFAFELTSTLLVIAVVGAVVLARRPARDETVGSGT
ncbi:MAG TPA: NADH-quinone oxidoreductase subunit J, partial [Acidimicrobiales bacterium]